VCGHTNPLQGYKGDNIPCFTSIREPIDRLVSLYYYVMDKWKRPVTVLLQDMSAQQVLAALSDIWPVMRQTPLLSHFGGCPKGLWFPRTFPVLRTTMLLTGTLVLDNEPNSLFGE
jgi:hypothetical protein